MNARVAVVLFIVLISLGTIKKCKAAEMRLFSLNVEIAEQVFLCLKYDAVEAIHKAAIKGDVKGVEKNATDGVVKGVCAKLPVYITYHKLLTSGYDADGNLFSIYEASVQGVRVYVPLRNFKHRNET